MVTTGQNSAAARCEELIGKHRGMFVDCTAFFSDLDPNKIPPELLAKIANRMIEQALGSQAAVEEVNLRLAAGETVTLDAVCQAVNETTRTTPESE